MKVSDLRKAIGNLDDENEIVVERIDNGVDYDTADICMSLIHDKVYIQISD